MQFGLKGRDVLMVFNASSIAVRSPLYVIFFQYLFSFIEFAVYAIIGVMISTVLKSRSVSVAVTVFVYFAGAALSVLLSKYEWYKYVLFNNTNLFMYMANGPALNDMTFVFSAVVIAVYLVLMMGTTFYVFQKRDAN
jgi:ABC-2 type transport system permease protein